MKYYYPYSFFCCIFFIVYVESILRGSNNRTNVVDNAFNLLDSNSFNISQPIFDSEKLSRRYLKQKRHPISGTSSYHLPTFQTPPDSLQSPQSEQSEQSIQPQQSQPQPRATHRHAKDHEKYRKKMAELRAKELAGVNQEKTFNQDFGSKVNNRNNNLPTDLDNSASISNDKPYDEPSESPTESNPIVTNNAQVSPQTPSSDIVTATPKSNVKETKEAALVSHSGQDTSPDSGLYDKSASATSRRGQLAKGKKAALFQVHFEGNLGDQMETIPLLQRLYEWGMQVDCYLSMWQDPAKRLDPKVKERVSKYVTNFYIDGIPQDHILKERNYDIAIITPGPTVNELTHCVGKVHMAWFGVSVTNWAVDTYVKHKHCLKFLAVREEVSFDKATRMMDPHFEDSKLVLSGDISFSYQALEPEVNAFKKQFQDSLGTFLEKTNWVLIFSRENNFGKNKGIFIENNMVKIRTIEEKDIEFNCDDVVFASSSDLEDNEHMKNMRSAYAFNRNRLVTFDSIEEMWALISLSPHVVTDRYHPGIAALIVGAKLTLTKYPNENVKMSGLNRMQHYGREEIRKMNEKAFDRLLQVVHKPKVVEHTVTSL